MVDGYKVGTRMLLINGTTTTLETPKQGTSFYTVRIFRDRSVDQVAEKTLMMMRRMVHMVPEIENYATDKNGR